MNQIDPTPLITLWIIFFAFILVGLAIGLVEAFGTLLH
jgi:hypothetical protein